MTNSPFPPPHPPPPKKKKKQNNNSSLYYINFKGTPGVTGPVKTTKICLDLKDVLQSCVGIRLLKRHLLCHVQRQEALTINL